MTNVCKHRMSVLRHANQISGDISPNPRVVISIPVVMPRIPKVNTVVVVWPSGQTIWRWDGEALEVVKRHLAAAFLPVEPAAVFQEVPEELLREGVREAQGLPGVDPDGVV